LRAAKEGLAASEEELAIVEESLLKIYENFQLKVDNSLETFGEVLRPSMSEDQFSRLEIRDKLEVLKKQIFVFF
jgi:hypothetical protein